jgi:hypothetical protein
VVLVNQRIVELREGGIGLGAAGIHSNFGVGVLAAREDLVLNGLAIFVLHSLIFFPGLLRQHLRKEGLGVAIKSGERIDVTGPGEVGSADSRLYSCKAESGNYKFSKHLQDKMNFK